MPAKGMQIIDPDCRCRRSGIGTEAYLRLSEISRRSGERTIYYHRVSYRVGISRELSADLRHRSHGY